MAMNRTLTARYVFPGEGPPLPGGTVTIQGEHIAAVERHGERRADVDFGNAAILPGFVNAHTHLDLTGMHGLCPPSADFTGWLRAVIQHRRQRTLEQVHADIEAGIAQCRRHGTTLVGDIASQGLSGPALGKAALWSVVFFELLGLTAERAETAHRQAQAWLEQEHASPAFPGLSPHAPFSVHRELFAHVARLAREQSLPVAIHLAESAAELELLGQHGGPFVDFLQQLGVWEPSGLVTSIQEVLTLFKRVNRPLFVHGNFLDPAQVSHGSVVYCPRTHAAFGQPPHPWRELLARGINVALGTDSLASNPDLSILAEARFLHRLHPEVGGATLLRLGTLNGAMALGCEGFTGSLAPGKSADLVVVPLPNRETNDPHTLIFDAELEVQVTFWRGTP